MQQVIECIYEYVPPYIGLWIGLCNIFHNLELLSIFSVIVLYCTIILHCSPPFQLLSNIVYFSPSCSLSSTVSHHSPLLYTVPHHSSLSSTVSHHSSLLSTIVYFSPPFPLSSTVSHHFHYCIQFPTIVHYCILLCILIHIDR